MRFPLLVAAAAALALSVSGQSVEARIGGGGCAPINLSLTTGAPSCAAGVSYATPTAVPGVSYSGAVSGTGATVRTAVDSHGVVVSFANNVLRTTDRGTLLEPGATNQLIRSQSFSNASWTNSNLTSIVDNSAVAPDGTTTASVLTANPGNYGTGILAAATVSLSASTQYTESCYVQAGTAKLMYLNPGAGDSSAEAQAGFNLTSGSLISTSANGTWALNAPTAKIEQVGPWLRVSLTFTNGSQTSATPKVMIGPYGDIDAPGGSIKLWGCQFEQGASATSYIPTTTAAVVRSADVLSLTHSLSSVKTQVYTQQTLQAPIALTEVSGASPLALGGASGGTWVGQYVQQVRVVPTGVVDNCSATPPAPAAAAGYTTSTYCVGAFTTSNMDITASNAPGFKMYCTKIASGTAQTANCNGLATLNADGSLTIAGNAGANLLIATASTGAVSPFYLGYSFGGGMYAETVMKFKAEGGRCCDFTAPRGWPAWWSFDIENQLGGAAWPGQPANTWIDTEVDFLEAFSPTSTINTTLHDWYAPTGSFASDISDGGHTSYPQGVAPADYSQWHRYGVLWVPATSTRNGVIQLYFDGVMLYRITYSKFTSQAPPPSLPWMWGMWDIHHQWIGYSADTLAPVTIRSLQVWQVDSSGDWIN